MAAFPVAFAASPTLSDRVAAYAAPPAAAIPMRGPATKVAATPPTTAAPAITELLSPFEPDEESLPLRGALIGTAKGRREARAQDRARLPMAAFFAAASLEWRPSHPAGG